MFLKMPNAEIKKEFPEWFQSIENRHNQYVSDYYNGWITDCYLDRKLDDLNRELMSMAKQLEKGNRNRILESDFMTEFPF